MVPDLGIMPGGHVVKWERGERRKKHGQRAQPTLTVAVFLRAMPQLGLDHRTQENIRDRKRKDFGVELAARILQKGDLQVGVRQEGHYHASRVSNSPCGGRSKGSLPNSPAMRVKKSTGKCSVHMAPFWVSTSSNASLTSFSKDEAARASNDFNLASNSSAMADMYSYYRLKVLAASTTSSRILNFQTNQTDPTRFSFLDSITCLVTAARFNR